MKSTEERLAIIESIQYQMKDRIEAAEGVIGSTLAEACRVTHGDQLAKVIAENERLLEVGRERRDLIIRLKEETFDLQAKLETTGVNQLAADVQRMTETVEGADRETRRVKEVNSRLMVQNKILGEKLDRCLAAFQDAQSEVDAGLKYVLNGFEDD